MKGNKTFSLKIIVAFILLFAVLNACTKYGKGFLSPSIQFANGGSVFVVSQGIISTSSAIIPDGSTVPMKVRILHIYDSTGTQVDSLLTKTYATATWTQPYNNLTDTTYALIMAKRSAQQMHIFDMNEANGQVTATPATINLKLGKYTIDVEVSNSAGVEVFPKMMTIVVDPSIPVLSVGQIGQFSNVYRYANTATTKTIVYNGYPNPYDYATIVRIADTPNMFILKFTDVNDKPFNPKLGEVTKLTNSGVNPIPPFLQSLQDYAPDTFVASDTAMSVKFPLVPFPIKSLGNGLNMYYAIRTAYIHCDSVKPWVGVPPIGTYYTGKTDPHYLGQYPDGLYDYTVRVPVQIQVAGTYLMTVKLLNITHK